MLSEALTALAAAGGTAVVQAAGTDGWAEIRQAVARLLSRANPSREGAALQRLDRTAETLTGVRESAEVRRQEDLWRMRFEAVLEELEGQERDYVINELRSLADRQSASRRGGTAVAGNVFHGPTALQAGDHNRQENHFGPGA